MCSRYKDIYLYSCYISAFLSYVVLSVLTVIIPSRLGEASKGKAYSSDKGGKGSSSHAVPTKSDAELKLELGQFPQRNSQNAAYLDANFPNFYFLNWLYLWWV